MQMIKEKPVWFIISLITQGYIVNSNVFTWVTIAVTSEKTAEAEYKTDLICIRLSYGGSYLLKRTGIDDENSHWSEAF